MELFRACFAVPMSPEVRSNSPLESRPRPSHAIDIIFLGAERIEDGECPPSVPPASWLLITTGCLRLDKEREVVRKTMEDSLFGVNVGVGC